MVYINNSINNTSDEDLLVTTATAGADRKLSITNTDNSAAASAAHVQVTVGGSTSTGDPYTNYLVTGAGTFSVGIDNSDSDKFKISASSALGTTDAMIITAAGEISYPLQSAFLATTSGVQNNVTGDDTQYTIQFATEIFDQNADFNSGTGIFTAPITGRYFISYSADITITTTTGGVQFGTYLQTSNRRTAATVWPTRNRVTNFYGSGGLLSGVGTVLIDMDAADTAYVAIYSSTGAKTDDVGGYTELTYFSGNLVC